MEGKRETSWMPLPCPVLAPRSPAPSPGGPSLAEVPVPRLRGLELAPGSGWAGRTWARGWSPHPGQVRALHAVGMQGPVPGMSLVPGNDELVPWAFPPPHPTPPQGDVRCGGDHPITKASMGLDGSLFQRGKKGLLTPARGGLGRVAGPCRHGDAGSKVIIKNLSPPEGNFHFTGRTLKT